MCIRDSASISKMKAAEKYRKSLWEQKASLKQKPCSEKQSLTMRKRSLSGKPKMCIRDRFYTTAINSAFAFLIAGGILFTRGVPFCGIPEKTDNL